MKEMFQTQQTSKYNIQGKRVNRQAESSFKSAFMSSEGQERIHIHETNTHTKAAIGRGGGQRVGKDDRKFGE